MPLADCSFYLYLKHSFQHSLLFLGLWSPSHSLPHLRSSLSYHGVDLCGLCFPGSFVGWLSDGFGQQEALEGDKTVEEQRSQGIYPSSFLPPVLAAFPCDYLLPGSEAGICRLWRHCLLYHTLSPY